MMKQIALVMAAALVSVSATGLTYLGMTVYFRFLSKATTDIAKFVAFILCLCWCFLLPILFLGYTVSYLQSHGLSLNQYSIGAIFVVWILPNVCMAIVRTSKSDDRQKGPPGNNDSPNKKL
jgi:ABC-type transport system involved in multi-copper enzyme maturation permease subunit